MSVSSRTTTNDGMVFRTMNPTILYDYAMSMVGQPYRWGGDDTIGGFDCSGLVVELLQSCGKLLNSVDLNAQGLYNHFLLLPIGIPLIPKLGCLAFYGKSSSAITHVGFCLDQSLMLNAGGGSSKTITREDAEKQNAFVKIRPIRYRLDLLEIFDPFFTERELFKPPISLVPDKIS